MLPHFKYHPDPIGTGSIEASAETCRCCGQARGYIYTAGVYRAVAVPPKLARYAPGLAFTIDPAKDLQGAFCPWCIADGSAAERFHCMFTNYHGVGTVTDVEVPDEVGEELTERTPGFECWQEQQWWTHCGDAGEFLGPVGDGDLSGRWAEAAAAIREVIERDGEPLDDDYWQHILEGLDHGGNGQAFVFRCRHCGVLGGYAEWC
jgi:uncharacterized protein CbrC (UPF0167 family)